MRRGDPHMSGPARCPSYDPRVRERDVFDRLVLAIDQTSVFDMLHVGHKVLSRVGCVKISSHLVQRMPPGRAFDFVRNHRARQLFYDARFVDDHPENLAADIRLLRGDRSAPIHAPEFVTVHYAVGGRSLASAVEAAGSRTEVVVFLSSSNWSVDDYQEMHGADPDDVVHRFARIAADAGCTSVMCAAADAWVVHDDPTTRHLKIYGTGIRSVDDEVGEQRRIVTPEVALANGVDSLVIGVPIVRSRDPAAALDRYGALVREALVALRPSRKGSTAI